MHLPEFPLNTECLRHGEHKELGGHGRVIFQPRTAPLEAIRFLHPHYHFRRPLILEIRSLKPKLSTRIIPPASLNRITSSTRNPTEKQSNPSIAVLNAAAVQSFVNQRKAFLKISFGRRDSRILSNGGHARARTRTHTEREGSGELSRTARRTLNVAPPAVTTSKYLCLVTEPCLT